MMDAWIRVRAKRVSPVTRVRPSDPIPRRALSFEIYPLPARLFGADKSDPP